MSIIEEMYQELGISQKVLDFGISIESGLKERFDRIDQVAEYNQRKVIKAMQENKVRAGCLNYASG